MSFSIRGFFTRHIGLKLASLFLSLVVFVHVYTEQEREWALDAPLDIVGISEDLCFVEPPPQSVEIKVRGKGKDLLKLRLSGARAVVDLADSEAGSVNRVLSGSDIFIPPDLDVTVAEVIEPKVLDVELDSRSAKMIRVVPVYSGSFEQGMELSGPPTVDPEEIRVSGARRVLAGLNYINTLPIDIDGMTSAGTVVADLDCGAMLLDLVPSAVQVTFLLEEREEDSEEGEGRQAARDSG